MGFVAKSGVRINLAIADLHGHPTNHLNSKKADDAVDPDEFWMSYRKDPTLEVLAVPVFASGSGDGGWEAGSDEGDGAPQSPSPATSEIEGTGRGEVRGVLLVQRPSLQAHYRAKQRQRKPGSNFTRRTPHRAAAASSPSRGSSLRSSLSTGSLPQGQEEPSAPYSAEEECAVAALARVIAAAIRQSEHDAGDGFADQARRFREKKTMLRVLRTMRLRVEERRRRERQHLKCDLEEAQVLIEDLRRQLAAAAEDKRASEAAVERAEKARDEALYGQKAARNDLDLLAAKHRCAEKELSQSRAAALQNSRAIEELKKRLRFQRSPDDVQTIKLLQEKLDALQATSREAGAAAKREKARMVIAHLTQQAKSQAFRSWNHACEQSRQNRAKAKRFLARVMHREGGRTFDAWVALLREAQRQRALLQRAARKMKYRRVATAYGSWMEYVELRDFLRSFLRRAIARHEKKEIAAGFGKWVSVALWERRAEDLQGRDVQRRRRSSFCAIS